MRALDSPRIKVVRDVIGVAVDSLVLLFEAAAKNVSYC